VFVQRAEQLDAEGVSNAAPEMIYVLEWKPKAPSLEILDTVDDLQYAF
jgi:hypothetical protein